MSDQNVVARLRYQCEHRSGMTEFYAIDYGELEALLAVVEAAQDHPHVWPDTEATGYDGGGIHTYEELGGFADLGCPVCKALARLNARTEPTP